MQITSATAADAAALRRLHSETWSHTYEALLPRAFFEQRLAAHRTRDWVTILQRQLEAGGGVIVARRDTELAGLCQYGPSEDADDDVREVGQIHRLYVLPAWQRQGVGRSLLTAATERLSRSGVSSLTLWALESDPGARTFYEEMGWRPDGASRFDGASDVRYRRSPDAPRA